MIKRDLKAIGYQFQWSKLDAQEYLLLQRRNRIYGLGDLDEGQNSETFSATMQKSLSSMASGVSFGFDQIFDKNLPKCTLKGNALDRMKEAIQKYQYQESESSNLFIDTATSSQREAEAAVGVATCVKPSHSIYSTHLERFLTVQELFHCQGIFKDDFHSPDAFGDVLKSQEPFKGSRFGWQRLRLNLLPSSTHRELDPCEGLGTCWQAGACSGRCEQCSAFKIRIITFK